MDRSKSRVRSRRTQHWASEASVRFIKAGGTGGGGQELGAGGACEELGVARVWGEVWPSVMQARADRSRLLGGVAGMRWRAAFARRTRRANSSSRSDEGGPQSDAREGPQPSEVVAAPMSSSSRRRSAASLHSALAVSSARKAGSSCGPKRSST